MSENLFQTLLLILINLLSTLKYAVFDFCVFDNTFLSKQKLKLKHCYVMKKKVKLYLIFAVLGIFKCRFNWIHGCLEQVST